MLSLAMLNHFCVQNAHAKAIVILAAGLDIFRLGPTATGGRMITSENLSPIKKTLAR
jgi:hypothetical protein